MPRKVPAVSRGAARSAAPSELEPVITGNLVWLKAAYRFHTFAYRDPRSAFSSGFALPVVSPTTVLLGIASTLLNLGRIQEARDFIGVVPCCRVAVDSPNGAVFFRAFHQLRRYYSTTKGRTERAGLTNINQGTREYGLLDGLIKVYVSVPQDHVDSVKLALANRDHLGTHDSLCSLVGEVEPCAEPKDIVYQPLDGQTMKLPDVSGLTVVTLSRFKKDHQLRPAVGEHWWMAGGDDTELVPYLIKGSFRGTSRGKIYRKN